MLLQMRQPEHSSLIDAGPNRLHHHRALVDQAGHTGRSRRALGHQAGISFGPWQAPAMKMPSVIVATGSSFGWRSMKKPSKSQPMPKICATSLESWRASMAGLRMTISTGMRRCLPIKRVLGLDDEFAFFLGHAGGVGHFGHPAPDEVGTLVQQPVVELLVALAGGAHVDVEVVDIGIRKPFVHQMGEFQRVHAADIGAVLVVVLVAASPRSG